MADPIHPIDPAGRVPENPLRKNPEGCLWLVAGMIPGGRKTIARLLGASAATPTATAEQRTYDKSGRLDPRELERTRLIETLERELAIQQLTAHFVKEGDTFLQGLLSCMRFEIFLDAEKIYGKMRLEHGVTDEQIDATKKETVSAIEVICSLRKWNMLSAQEAAELSGRFQGKLATRMIDELRAGREGFEDLV